MTSLALTPPMGWNSWNTFGHAINEAVVRETADALVSTGLRDHGYNYVVIDDCWSIKDRRDGNGDLIGQRRKYGDIFLRKRLGLGALDIERTDHVPTDTQRECHFGAGFWKVRIVDLPQHPARCEARRATSRSQRCCWSPIKGDGHD